jgi:hypothetical protein
MKDESVTVSSSSVLHRVYKEGQLVFTCVSTREATKLAEFAKTHTVEECASHARNSQVKAYGKPASRIAQTRRVHASDESIFAMAKPSKAIKKDEEELGLAAKALKHARSAK